MQISLPDSEYTFLSGYQLEKKYRDAFNQLSVKVFGLSFVEWYESGYWKDKYIPYTLFDGDRAVANVSVNIMDFNVLGVKRRYIQLGTVMTDEDYRNRHLSAFLMERVLQEWNEKCELIYLYANGSVLGFYPKFGFDRVREYECFKPAGNNAGDGKFEKLNMDVRSNRELLHDYAKHSRVYGRLALSENADLVLFYCITFLKDCVYYNKSLDVIAVAGIDGETLCLWDVFSGKEVELAKIEYSLGNFNASEMVLGFTPKDSDAYQIREISGKDALFIQRGKTAVFDENTIMFPLLSHA